MALKSQGGGTSVRCANRHSLIYRSLENYTFRTFTSYEEKLNVFAGFEEANPGRFSDKHETRLLKPLSPSKI
jgi:hypothetical protein